MSDSTFEELDVGELPVQSDAEHERQVVVDPLPEVQVAAQVQQQAPPQAPPQQAVQQQAPPQAHRELRSYNGPGEKDTPVAGDSKRQRFPPARFNVGGKKLYKTMARKSRKSRKTRKSRRARKARKSRKFRKARK